MLKEVSRARHPSSALPSSRIAGLCRIPLADDDTSEKLVLPTQSRVARMRAQIPENGSRHWGRADAGATQECPIKTVCVASVPARKCGLKSRRSRQPRHANLAVGGIKSRCVRTA